MMKLYEKSGAPGSTPDMDGSDAGPGPRVDEVD